MDDLLAEFVAETREMLEAIEGELVAWEAAPSDRARLDTIFRFVHTVKGNCGFFDFPRLENLSHAAEGTLAEVRAGRRAADSQLVSAVLAIIDQITVMIGAIEAGEEMPATGDECLIAALEGDADQTVAPPPAPAEEGPELPEQLPEQSLDPSASTTADNLVQTPRSVRLPVELLDRLMSGVSDMVLARNDLARRLRDAGDEPALDGPFERLTTILTDVREAVTKMRMQRIEHLYNALPRLVRDLSNELGKHAIIEFEGGNVELDREMIEMIRDPVVHLIRNALDHGIETPDQRLKAGKRGSGLLTLAARQSGNRITLAISDDGAGLNLAKIGKQAVAAGLVNKAQLGAMSDNDIANLIFEPGLSTAQDVSAVSGRGVGMDVVRANVEKIGGTIGLSTTAGEGTLFWLHIPLTLSIISALTVSIEGQCFAIPHSYLEEIAHGASASVEFSRVGQADLVTFRGKRIPCLTLNNVLGVKPRSAGWDQKIILLRLGTGDLFALAVDRVHDQDDLVIKPLAPAIMKTGLYAGVTLQDDGSPVLLLDIPNIAQQHGLVSDTRTRSAPTRADSTLEPTGPARMVMTFVGLDGRCRAIDMELVTRIDRVSSEAFAVDDGRSHVVIDGQIKTLVGVGNDATETAIPEGKVKVLRLSDSECELAYAVAELGESVKITGDLADPQGDPSLEGIALIGGKPVPIIDGYRLFAQFGELRVPAALAKTPKTKPVCRLPEGDEWAERMLLPLVSAAGYRIASGKDESADVTIALADGDSNNDTGHSLTGRIIRIHSDPDANAATDGSLYRYDRAGLVNALRTIRAGDTA